MFIVTINFLIQVRSDLHEEPAGIHYFGQIKQYISFLSFIIFFIRTLKWLVHLYSESYQFTCLSILVHKTLTVKLFFFKTKGISIFLFLVQYCTIKADIIEYYLFVKSRAVAYIFNHKFNYEYVFENMYLKICNKNI